MGLGVCFFLTFVTQSKGVLPPNPGNVGSVFFVGLFYEL